MATAAKALHVAAGEGGELRFGPNRIEVKVGPETGARGASLFVSKFPTGGGFPMPHVHRSCEELHLVLEGEVEYRLGDERVQGTTGSAVFVPPGVFHSFQNVSSGEARIAVVLSPAEALDMIVEIARVGPDPEKMAEVLGRYDSFLVGAKP